MKKAITIVKDHAGQQTDRGWSLHLIRLNGKTIGDLHLQQDETEPIRQNGFPNYTSRRFVSRYSQYPHFTVRDTRIKSIRQELKKRFLS